MLFCYVENGHFSSVWLEILKSREGPLVASLYHGYMVGNSIPILHQCNISSASSTNYHFYNEDHLPKDPVQLLLKNAQELQMKMHPEN